MDQTMERPNRVLTVVSVDPGNNLGLARLDFDPDTNLITVVDAHTLILDDIIKHYHAELLETHDVLLSRTYVVNKYLGGYCQAHSPDFLAHETAFSSHGRARFGNAVESFAKLRENILAIKLAAMNYRHSLPIVPINPMTVKFAVIDKQNSDKSQISDALKLKTELVWDCDHSYLDEHGWDAIAIGYSFIKKRLMRIPNHEHSKRNQRPKRNKTKRAR